MDEPVEFATAKHPSKRRLVLAAIAGLVLVIAGGVAWRLRSPGTSVSNARLSGATPTVAVTAAGPGTIENRLSELGTVTPLASVTVKTQITGVLQTVNFTEGQSVAQGDFLAQIDDRPYHALLAQSQGTLARDKSLLAQAKTNLARFQRLARQDSIAQQTADDQRDLVTQDAGNVATDEAAVAAQRLNITYCHITAPVGGKVGLRAVDPGNYVTSSDTNGIVTITQLEPISVLFSIPEDNIPALQTALKTGRPIPITLFDRGGSTQLAAGSLSTINNQIDTSTGTLKMRALFPNIDDALVPNQFVNVNMLLNAQQDTLSVPVGAIQTGAPGTYVYTVDDKNTAHVTLVTLGTQDANRVQILAGLSNGERVVTDGIDHLRDGIAVTVAGPATAPATARPDHGHKAKPAASASSAGP
jgi:multidrug efflux system membrane fusion protein